MKLKLGKTECSIRTGMSNARPVLKDGDYIGYVQTINCRRNTLQYIFVDISGWTKKSMRLKELLESII